MAEIQDIYQCRTVNCGYLYNLDKEDRKGKIAKGTKFENLPDDWKCPICEAGKKIRRLYGWLKALLKMTIWEGQN